MSTNVRSCCLKRVCHYFESLGDAADTAHVLLDLGYAARLQGDNARALAYYTESSAMFHELRYSWGIAAVQLARGYLAQAQGDAAQAAVCFVESLVRYRDLGHREGISVALAGLAGATGSRVSRRKQPGCSGQHRHCAMRSASSGNQSSVISTRAIWQTYVLSSTRHSLQRHGWRDRP